MTVARRWSVLRRCTKGKTVRTHADFTVVVKELDGLCTSPSAAAKEEKTEEEHERVPNANGDPLVISCFPFVVVVPLSTMENSSQPLTGQQSLTKREMTLTSIEGRIMQKREAKSAPTVHARKMSKR